MSDIRGEGYGSKHNWTRVSTLQRNIPIDRMTLFQCANCHRDFWHRYRITSDIFQAMKEWGIPEECKEAK